MPICADAEDGTPCYRILEGQTHRLQVNTTRRGTVATLSRSLYAPNGHHEYTQGARRVAYSPVCQGGMLPDVGWMLGGCWVDVGHELSQVARPTVKAVGSDISCQ